uniref:Thioredoxin domain-containing protein n=1 Tax=Aegilops tauschii subsp. strangulata TaxID=200361 RepID=A0A453D1U0_AEGTS
VLLIDEKMHGMGLMITYCVLDSECRFFMSTSRVTLVTLSLHVVQVAAHFGASWCVTSLSMNYKFEELAQTHPDMLFLFVDVDDVPGVSSKLGVKAMPTFFLIKGKEVVKKIVGANSDELHKMVDASDDDSLGSAVTTLPDIVIEK